MLLLLGCAKVEEAPRSVDDLFHWFWTGFEDAADADVRLAAEEADGLLTDDLRGSISDMSEDEQALVEMDVAADPAAARGMYIADVLGCDLSQVERIMYDLEQDEIYDGYDSYERAYTSDFDAYVARETPLLTWETTYTASRVGSTYTEFLRAGLRWVPAGDEGVGPVLLSRVWMPAPAVFEGGSSTFEQDYQIEALFERAPGEVVHFYGIWRQMDFGGDLDTDNDGVVNLILDGLEDFERDTTDVCASGEF